MQKTPVGAKIFAIFSIIFVLLLVQFMRKSYTFSTQVKVFQTEREIERKTKVETKNEVNKPSSKKHVLFWTKRLGSPYWGIERESFTVDDCIFTHKRDFLDNSAKYDALMFHVFEKSWGENPKARSSNQSYIMVTAE